jgi:hypothetical protein
MRLQSTTWAECALRIFRRSGISPRQTCPCCISLPKPHARDKAACSTAWFAARVRKPWSLGPQVILLSVEHGVPPSSHSLRHCMARWVEARRCASVLNRQVTDNEFKGAFGARIRRAKLRASLSASCYPHQPRSSAKVLLSISEVPPIRYGVSLTRKYHLSRAAGAP